MGKGCDCGYRLTLKEVNAALVEATGTFGPGIEEIRRLAKLHRLHIGPDWAGRESLSVVDAHRIAKEYAIKRQRDREEADANARRLTEARSTHRPKGYSSGKPHVPVDQSVPPPPWARR